MLKSSLLLRRCSHFNLDLLSHSFLFPSLVPASEGEQQGALSYLHLRDGHRGE